MSRSEGGTVDARAVAEVSRFIDSLPEGSRLVGVAGAPGSGKSAITQAVAAARHPRPPIVAMDGFHLAHEELIRLGRDHRRGAIDTFDGHGFVALLERIRSQDAGSPVYAPVFDRSRKVAIAAAVRVSASDALVLIEGNYLLARSEPWAAVRPLLDGCVYLEADTDVRRSLLVARHVAGGRSEADAARFVEESDEVNARLVETSRDRADVVVPVELT